MMDLVVEALDKLKFFGLRKIYYTGKSAVDAFYDFIIDYRALKHPLEQSLTKRKTSRLLIKEYSGDEGHNINTTQHFIGFGLIHYALVRNTKPARILCVGSRKGFIPAILALACKDNRYGHVDFVDAGYDKNEPTKHWSGIGFWKKVNPSEHFANAGASDQITTYVMTSVKFAKKFPNRRYQYIYVDGDHSYRGVKLDYSLFWPRLDTRGFIVFHDVVARGYLDKGKFGVWKLWQEIGDKNAIIFPFPKDSGLGIVQKP